METLVTGARGQLGRELAYLINKAGRSDECVFASSEQLDITNPSAVLETVQRMQPRVIINCAAYTQVDQAESEPENADAVNHRGAAHLAAAAKEVHSLLLHISTDYVFGNSGSHMPITEQTAPNPMGVYGRTKLAGEQAIRASGCRHIILRTSWLYSAYGSNFVKTMLRLMHERPEIRVVNDQIGSPTYARDLAAAILQILRSGVPDGKLGTYHYCNIGACSWYDFARTICEYAGLSEKCRVLPCSSAEYPTKATRPPFSALDTTTLRHTFDLCIPRWQDSLRGMLSDLSELS